MAHAGRLDRRCLFETRDTTPDDYGNVTSGGWTPIGTFWAQLTFERGRERMEAGRMESAVGATLKLHSSATTRSIAAADRVTIDGESYAIRAVWLPPRSGVIEMTIEKGVAP
jgi:SPP1 family predicted phage head-tail adaptor